ncbi:MAG TPA: FimV/HubP family polar landmark protein [Ottowia sp.]|nr:FimV/HubP family polar landmark protein [Ottowia sp.]HOK12012.1 FimV/HubP family polar landmark protein [Ottowia sp.]HOM20629.1 FimV/HubP family polar landmark protein [Ottowia sp.]
MLATAAALALLGASLDAQALALGAITVRSALGEPLRAEIEVPQISSEEAATLKASVGSPEAFRAAGVDYPAALAGARVTLQRRANGQAYLRVAGERTVNEPFLGIVIEANWANGRVVRDYTMLVDPPGRAAPPAVTVTPSQVAPAPATVQAPRVAAAPAPAPATEAGARPRRDIQPAEVPRRAAAPGGDGAPVTVQRGDTAGSIARAHAIDGVSLDQMLVAMLRANPQAFIKGNVNLMRAGAVLQMPSAEQASATSRQAARRAVVAQTRDFQAYRLGVAQRSGATRVAAATGSASGGVQPEVQDSRAAAPSQDRLKLSRSGTQSGAESQLAQSRQAQEQSERVAELNKNLSELAKLQAASGNAPAAAINVPTGAPAATTPAPAPAPAAPPEPATPAATPASAAAEASSAPASATPPVAGTASAAAVATDAASAATAAASAEAAPAPRPTPTAPPPPPVAEPSFLDALTDNPLLPIAGAGLLALLAGYGVYRSRQRKKDAAPLDSSFIESRLQPDSFFGASGGQRVDTRDGRPSAGGSSSMVYSPSQLDAAGDVDPVAEADVYLAYGRDMQAEEILKEALRTHPARIGVHRKLAEIYAKRRDARALEAIASEAYGVVKGEGPDWEAITSLGSELEPDNPLYKPGGAPVVRPVVAAAPQRRFGADTEPQTAQLNDRRDSKPDSSSIPLDLELDLDDAPVRAGSTDSTLPPIDSHQAKLDRDERPAAAVAAATSAAIPLDIDLDLDTPPKAEPPAAAAPAATATVAPPPKTEAKDPPAPEPYVASKSGMIDFDMAALSVDPDSRSGAEPKTEQLEDDDEDPLATKLALAQEFHAIGDTEGARTLVKEVIDEAEGSLRMRAERFLAELD